MKADEFDLYARLGLDVTASDAQVAAASRAAARRHHPDSGGSEESFRHVQVAREVLRSQRATYDSLLIDRSAAALTEIVRTVAAEHARSAPGPDVPHARPAPIRPSTGRRLAGGPRHRRADPVAAGVGCALPTVAGWLWLHGFRGDVPGAVAAAGSLAMLLSAAVMVVWHVGRVPGCVAAVALPALLLVLVERAAQPLVFALAVSTLVFALAAEQLSLRRG